MRRLRLVLILAVAILTAVVVLYRANLNISLPPIPQDLQFGILVADVLIATGIFAEVSQNFLEAATKDTPLMSTL